VSDSKRPRAVLDADIIYSRVMHELIGRVAAELRLLDLFWSEQLLTEAQRSLIEKKRIPPDSAQRWVDYLRRNFPGGIDPEQAPVPDLASLTSDPADAHVCALAVAANADYLSSTTAATCATASADPCGPLTGRKDHIVTCGFRSRAPKTRTLQASGKRGTEESNLALRFWRPPCYRYTSPPAGARIVGAHGSPLRTHVDGPARA
jgi:PIN domain